MPDHSAGFDAVALPKVLLHDHLDGGLRIETLLELSGEVGRMGALPATDHDGMRAWLTDNVDSGDLLRYLATFEHTMAVMQTPEHIERVAYEAAIDLARDGVVYAEVRFAPELHDSVMPLREVTDAVTAGFCRGQLDAAAEGRAITVNAIVCAMRTEQRSEEIVRFLIAERERNPKLVAFDIAGAETGWPPSLHAEAFRLAREAHLNITVHASEPPDLELISDGIAQGAHRIGHGVRVRRDITRGADGELQLGPLAQYVLDHRIHLEMAPTCHVHVAAVDSIADHPIAMLMRAGFNVSINTDNRLMSNVMPSSEHAVVAAVHGLEVREMERFSINALQSAFITTAERNALIAERVRPFFAAVG